MKSPDIFKQKPGQKIFFMLSLVLAIAAFLIFAWPNSVAAENMGMVQMFQPDEAAPLPYIFKMIAPTGSVEQSLRNFVFYEYYYYGFPHFGASALSLLPLQWLGLADEMQWVILVLRQFISVLPLLAGLLLLVYMQDGFRTYRSPLLFAFLASVPAGVHNNFWWHPDGLAFLMAVITLFFLWRDDLRFGRNFLLAAALCGLATATKLIGVHFFLAVALTLLLGLVLKKASWKKLLGVSLAYLGIMGASFLLFSPFLVSGWARTSYRYILYKEAVLLSEGYSVVYERGLEAAYPLIRQYYGEAIFLLVILAATCWGIWRKPERLLYALILAWFVPLTVVVLFISHFKFQYWLPAALPFLSNVIILLPEKWSLDPLRALRSNPKRNLAVLVGLLALLVAGGQWVSFLIYDAQAIPQYAQRAENNPRILLYDQVIKSVATIEKEQPFIYYDYRLYAPAQPGWSVITSYELLDYTYIQQNNFDVLVLLQQRIHDYLNPNAAGLDAEQFALNQKFYQDAQNETLAGYRLFYRDATGLIYVRTDLVPPAP